MQKDAPGSRGFDDLTEIVPWGRDFAEYVQIFELTDQDLRTRILDCGAGPASFAAEAHERGFNVVACDPLYQVGTADIVQRFEAIFPVMVRAMHVEQERFVWTHASSPEQVSSRRRAALERFVADLPSGLEEGRYVVQALPSLTFPNDAFDLALSSHLLFLYSDRLSEAIHYEAIVEMLRVAKEARIFPILAMDGRVSLHLEPVRDRLLVNGYQADLIEIGFEFQRGGNRLLRVRRGR